MKTLKQILKLFRRHTIKPNRELERQGTALINAQMKSMRINGEIFIKQKPKL